MFLNFYCIASYSMIFARTDSKNTNTTTPPVHTHSFLKSDDRSELVHYFQCVCTLYASHTANRHLVYFEKMSTLLLLLLGFHLF